MGDRATGRCVVRPTGRPLAIGLLVVALASLLASSLTWAATGVEGQTASRHHPGASRGAGWSAPTLIDPAFVARAVSCPQQTFCVAVGGGAVRLYSNGTWRTPATIDPHPGSPGLASVSCASRSFCVAVAAGHAITYRGAWGSPQQIDGRGGLVSVSCPTSRFCAAVDSSGDAFLYRGRWSAGQKIDKAGGLVAVSCASARRCAAVDRHGYAILYKGRWGAPAKIDPRGRLTSVSCATASFCVAVDRAGYELTYTGGGWKSKRVDTGGGDVRRVSLIGLTAVSCARSPASVPVCSAITVEGHPLNLIKGKWYPPTQNFAYGGLTSVSCAPHALFCVAVGGGGDGLRFENYHWFQAWIGGGSLAVACPLSSFCVAVDYGGHALIRTGGKWSAPQLIDPRASLTAVSCASPSFCVAVDNRGHALMRRGGAWSKPQRIDAGGGLLTGVSCAPRSSFCAAVDVDNRALTYKGGKWSKPQRIDKGGGEQWNGVTSVSCPSTTFCMAMDQHDAIAYKHGRWKPTLLDPQGGTLVSVSCASTRFCLEAEIEGDSRVYINGKWGPSRGPDASGELHSAACASFSFMCSEVGLSDEVRYQGHGHPPPLGNNDWTKPRAIDSQAPLSSVSCPSASFCVAVDLSGRAIMYGGH